MNISKKQKSQLDELKAWSTSEITKIEKKQSAVLKQYDAIKIELIRKRIVAKTKDEYAR